jgi:hypothetical protein
MSNTIMTVTRRAVLTLAAMAAIAIPALGQPVGNIRTIIRYRVKPDRMGDFRAAVKDYAAVLKRANFDRSGTWWRSESGPLEYAFVQYHSKFAELDVTRNPKLKEVAAELAPLRARMSQCADSIERTVDEIQPELSLPRTGEPPAMVRVIRTVVKPDKVDEFVALYKSEIVPAMKKAGVKTAAMARTRFGGPRSEFRSSASIDGWAALDGPAPVVQAMGEAKYRAFLAKYSALVNDTEYNIYRYMPDLSYLAPQAHSSSGGQ